MKYDPEKVIAIGTHNMKDRWVSGKESLEKETEANRGVIRRKSRREERRGG